MTDEEKEKYRGGLIATCKTYCHIDYDDDIEILELMLDTTPEQPRKPSKTACIYVRERTVRQP